jgi:prepilin-type N-terminal cleavage/methylation domain-containing protein
MYTPAKSTASLKNRVKIGLVYNTLMLKFHGQRGFTVIEGLLVLAVLGVLAWVGYAAWSNSTKTKTPGYTAAQTWQKGGPAIAGKYADACIVKVNDTTWRMYYGVQPEGMGGQLNIYSSTSSDGKTWTQEAGARKTMGTFPEVLKLPDGRWRMYFQQAGAIKSAISTDGLAFTDEPGTRIDTAGDSPVTENAAAPAVTIQADGTYALAYRATITGSTRYSKDSPNPQQALLLWATSPDGLVFTKKGIGIDPRNPLLDGQIDGATFVKWDDGKTRVYFTSYGGVFMSTFDGTKFSESTLAYAGGAHKSGTSYGGPPPGDPTLAKIGGTWYMYFGGGPEDPGIHYATLK